MIVIEVILHNPSVHELTAVPTVHLQAIVQLAVAITDFATSGGWRSEHSAQIGEIGLHQMVLLASLVSNRVVQKRFQLGGQSPGTGVSFVRRHRAKVATFSARHCRSGSFVLSQNRIVARRRCVQMMWWVMVVVSRNRCRRERLVLVASCVVQ